MKDRKSVSESATTLSVVMMLYDANHYGNVHGGTILKLVDEASYATATRHSHSNVVVASVERMDFCAPVHVGDIIILDAKLIYVGRSSMDVKVEVVTEKLKTGERLYVGTAYVTLVALDNKGKPKTVPGLAIKTREEKREFEEAKKRRKLRERTC